MKKKSVTQKSEEKKRIKSSFDLTGLTVLSETHQKHSRKKSHCYQLNSKQLFLPLFSNVLFLFYIFIISRSFFFYFQLFICKKFESQL